MTWAGSTTQVGGSVAWGILWVVFVRGEHFLQSFLRCSPGVLLTVECSTTRYNHYVQLIEPAGPRACIRCCVDGADCPTHQGTSNCWISAPGYLKVRNTDGLFIRQNGVSKRDYGELFRLRVVVL